VVTVMSGFHSVFNSSRYRCVFKTTPPPGR